MQSNDNVIDCASRIREIISEKLHGYEYLGGNIQERLGYPFVFDEHVTADGYLNKFMSSFRLCDTVKPAAETLRQACGDGELKELIGEQDKLAGEAEDAAGEIDKINGQILKLIDEKSSIVSRLFRSNAKSVDAVLDWLGGDMTLIHQEYTKSGFGSPVVREYVSRCRRMLFDESDPAVRSVVCSQLDIKSYMYETYPQTILSYISSQRPGRKHAVYRVNLTFRSQHNALTVIIPYLRNSNLSTITVKSGYNSVHHTDISVIRRFVSDVYMESVKTGSAAL